MSEDDDRQRQLAINVVESATIPDREALRMWAGALLDLRSKDMPVTSKAKEAVLVTSRAKVVWPLLKIVSVQVKKHGWDNRSTSQRLGIGAAGSALALFGPAQGGYRGPRAGRLRWSLERERCSPVIFMKSLVSNNLEAQGRHIR